MAGNRTKDIKGQKFSRLIAIKFKNVDKHRFAWWLFKCVCGNKVIKPACSVRSGLIKSCGCLNNEVRRQKHFTDEELKRKRANEWKVYYRQNKKRLLKKAQEYAKKKKRNYKTEAQKAKNRRKTDINYRIKMNLRNRLLQAIKLETKGGSFIRNLGCSIEEFKNYLENKFQKGMNWNNYGKWQIDHIIPLSSFDLRNPKDFKKAVYFTNHQPLWAKDNQRKGANLTI